MAVWHLLAADDDGDSIGEASAVGDLGDALDWAVLIYPDAEQLVLRQVVLDARLRGTDGCDGGGTELTDRLPVGVAELERSVRPPSTARWLARKFHPADRAFRFRKTPLDKDCKCSRCGGVIGVEDHFIDFNIRRRFYRYHSTCLGVRYLI